MEDKKPINRKYESYYVVPKKYRPKILDSKKRVEKVWGFSALSFLGLLLLFIIKYFVDFWLLPYLFNDLYPLSVGAIILWITSSLFFIFLALKFVTRIGFFYPAAFMLYGVLVWVLPNGMFEIGDSTQSLILATIMYILMRIIQRTMLWVFVLIGFVKMRFKISDMMVI